MNIAVLGGTGFLGSALIDTLLEKGYDKSNIISVGSHSLKKRVDVTVLHRNLTLEDQVHWVYKYIGQDSIVINLAAFVGGIGLNKENPGKMFYENMRIGLFCTHLAQRYDIKKYIYIGTVCGYPKFTPVPFKEDDLWNGFPEETNAPYGVVKKSIGLMMQSYNQQYGFPGMFLIPVNMYGPRDNFDLDSSHVIPALIRKMLEAKEAGKDVTLWGDGSATREFLYVYDCAEAIVSAMKQYDGCDPINIGSGQEISIKDLATKIADIVGFEGRIIWDTTKPNGQPRRCLDTTKAFEKFGFKAKTSLDDGLRKTVEWYVEQK